MIAERTVRDAIRLGFKYGELISQEHAVGKAMKLRWCGSDPAGRRATVTTVTTVTEETSHS